MNHGWGSQTASPPVVLPAWLRKACLLLTLCTGGLPAHAAVDVLLEPQQFVAEQFGGTPPKPEAIWLTGTLGEQVSEILGHRPPQLRLRYWREDDRSVWVMNEIGKEKPITVGVSINEQRIDQLRVLIYRESRGWEVKFPFFTDQFHSAQLNGGSELDRSIDGISGATLSVHALTKLARIALLLDQHIRP